MARTVTTAERNVLAARHAIHFLRVQVANAAGTLVDLGSVGGANYQLSATIVSAVDTPADTATVTVRAGAGATSIAPLMASATANASGRLLDVGRRIVVSVAVLAPGTTPVTDDWHQVFNGTIDTIAQGDGQRLTLSCRDRMLPILDAFTPATTAIFPASAESMIASLLTLGLGGGAPALVTPVASGWTPAQIPVTRGDALWPLMSGIADQLGWTIRYRWNGNTPELRFYAPNRSAVTPAEWAFASGEVARVQEASLDLSAVRNDIQVGWRTSPTAALQIALAQDSASITDYGQRTLIIDEEASSQIDTSTEAQVMADAILADLKLPPFSHTLTHRHAFWCAEVGDVINVPANGHTHDATLRLAVMGTELSLAGGGGSMTLRLRGTPASRTTSWLGVGGSDDTTPVPLLTRARIIATGATTHTVRVSSSAPRAIRDGTIVLTQNGGLTVTRGGGALVEGSTETVTVSTEDGYYGTIGGTAAVAFRDYVVTRGVYGTQPTRVTWRVDAFGAISDADSVDVTPQDALVPGRIAMVHLNETGAVITVGFRAYDSTGAQLTSTSAVTCGAETIVSAGGTAVISALTVTRDTGNGWFAISFTRIAGSSYKIIPRIVASATTAATETTYALPSLAPAPVVDTTPRIESISVTNTGSSGTSGNLRVVFGGLNLPAGGSYRLSVDASTFVSANVYTGATSPVTIASTVYTDGVAPPSGKSVDRARGTLEMLDSSGVTVASAAIPYNQFWGII